MDAIPATEDTEDAVLFDATLHPYRSLGRRGFAFLMAAVALVGFAGGLAFVYLGAWPVTGFGIVELGLFYVMFQLNYRSARLFERVRVTREELTVERHELNGQIQRWQFQTYWLRVAMDDPPTRDSQLTLSSHGRQLAIGSFLTPSERADFARALKAALAGAR
ncbi:MAG TPA: DUF2244 domain-containing protein [Dongiaceae bacterium]|jgi:uncharacterized membrane protein